MRDRVEIVFVVITIASAILLMMMSLRCVGVQEKAPWYVYDISDRRCKIAIADDGLDLGPDFATEILHDCSSSTQKIESHSITILDCRENPTIRGVILYGRTETDCEFIAKKFKTSSII